MVDPRFTRFVLTQPAEERLRVGEGLVGFLGHAATTRPKTCVRCDEPIPTGTTVAWVNYAADKLLAIGWPMCRRCEAWIRAHGTPVSENGTAGSGATSGRATSESY